MYAYMKKRNGSPREIKNISSPCFDSFPNQYSSLPTREDKLEIKRQSSFSGTNGSHVKLLSNGTFTKSNNVSGGHHTPKVLSKSSVEVDSARIKRNLHGPLRNIDDDKF